METSNPSNKINFNVDDLLKIIQTYSNSINMDGIKKIINNKDKLVQIVEECKHLFTKDQLNKIERGIYDLEQLLRAKNPQPCHVAQTPIPTCVLPAVQSPIHNSPMNETFLHFVLFFLVAILVVPRIQKKWC